MSRRLPTMEGTIERRLLVNYRVDPEALVKLLPAPFRPHVIGGLAWLESASSVSASCGLLAYHRRLA